MALAKEQAELVKKQIYQQLEKFPSPQTDALKKQIEKMSPSELEEFIKQQQKMSSQKEGIEETSCLFCNIASGKQKSIKIYEDSNVIAFLDIMPASKGHTLLISKNHKQFLNDFSKEEIAEIFDSLKKVDKLLIKSLKAEGSNILINQGEIAGQRIPHFFINIIPRYNDDNINLDFPREKAEEKDLEKIASSIISEKSKEEDKKEKEKKKEFRDKTKKEIRKIHKSTPSRFAEFV